MPQYEIAKPSADCICCLPQPRRFGKSLMLSTLKALFQGRRELFKGLAIEKTDWDWEKEVYPVLHLDMSMAASDTSPDRRNEGTRTQSRLAIDSPDLIYYS